MFYEKINNKIFLITFYIPHQNDIKTFLKVSIIKRTYFEIELHCATD